MTTPVEILKKIYPRVETTLEIPIPTIKDITKIIKKSKSKNSVGHDNISMNMLKKNNKNNGTTHNPPNQTNNTKTKIPRNIQTRQDHTKTKTR